MVFNRPVLVGVAVGVLLVGAGCSPDKPSGAPKATASPSAFTAPSALPSDTAERDAVIAYRGMWSAVVEAAKTSDPEAPDLRTYASDQALRLVASSLYTDRDLGKVTKGNLVLNPKVTNVKPAQAPKEVTILDCVDSTKWLKSKASGGLWDNEPGGKHRTTATERVKELRPAGVKRFVAPARLAGRVG